MATAPSEEERIPSPRSIDGHQTQQYKSFVAWINHHARAKGINVTVTNLEDSLEDGLLLIELLEHLSGQKLATPVRKPTLRVQKINNLAIAFKQLRREIHVENIAPEDIADRNVKIVMGLVWSLILRYQIASLEGSIKSGGVLDEEQRQTLIEYVGRYLKAENVTVQSFEHSDGLAFCALLKLLKPDAVNLPALRAETPRVRLKQAFTLWEQFYGIPQFLDAEELVSKGKADERSVMTYVALCLAVLERNRIPCAPAEGRKLAQSGKNKFMFMSSALMPKTKAIDSMDLSSSTISLDFSGKRLPGLHGLHSPRDLDASLRNNPLLSPRHHNHSAHTSPRPSPAGSPHIGRYRVPALDTRSASATSLNDPRQVQTARAGLASSGSSKDLLAKSEAAKLHEELDTQISKLVSIVEAKPGSLTPSSSSTALTTPAPAAPPATSPAPAPATAAAPTPAPAPASPATAPSTLLKTSSGVLLTAALEQIESVTLTLAPKTKPEAPPSGVTSSPAGSSIVAETQAPPPVPRPANYTPSAPPLPSASALPLTEKTVIPAAVIATAPAPVPATTTAPNAAAAPSTQTKTRPFALISTGEFMQLVGASTSAVSSAAKTFIGDIRGKNGAAELRQVTTLRPLIVVVVRETGALLAAMADGRESRELIAGVKSFIIAGYQLTASLAREGETSALKDALQTLVCQIKLLLRNLAWLGEP